MQQTHCLTGIGRRPSTHDNVRKSRRRHCYSKQTVNVVTAKGLGKIHAHQRAVATLYEHRVRATLLFRAFDKVGVADQAAKLARHAHGISASVECACISCQPIVELASDGVVQPDVIRCAPNQRDDLVAVNVFAFDHVRGMKSQNHNVLLRAETHVTNLHPNLSMAEAFEKLASGLGRLTVQRSPDSIQLDRAGWVDASEPFLDNVGVLMDSQRGDAVIAVGAVFDGPMLTKDEVDSVVKLLCGLCRERRWTMTPLADVDADVVAPAQGHPGVECLVRRDMEVSDFIEVKVATAGNVDAGESAAQRF